jgi:VCBS repeat-containing protein
MTCHCQRRLHDFDADRYCRDERRGRPARALAGNGRCYGYSFTDAGSLVSADNVLAGRSGDILAPTITAVNGNAGNVGNSVAGTYGTLIILDNGNYTYTANSAFDALQSGDTLNGVFNFTATDSHGQSVTTTLTFNITGGDDNPVITAADSTGSMTEDAGPTVLVDGRLETGNLSGWSTSGVQEFELGGQFGRYSALLSPTGTLETLSQDVLTTPGKHYTVSFSVLADVDASSNFFSATWEGQTPLAVGDLTSGGFNHYTFDVAGDPTNVDTILQFSYGRTATASCWTEFR